MILATDARVLNALANHPTCFPTIAPRGQTDPLAFDLCLEADRRHRFRFFHDETESMGAIFAWSAPLPEGGAWEMHVIALPEARGRTIIEFGRSAMREMFDHHGAHVIWGEPPLSNPAVRLFTRKIGGVSRGFDNCPLVGAVELFSVSREDWSFDKYGMKSSNSQEG